MAPKRRPSAPHDAQAVWAYSYEIDPPQPEDKLRRVRAMLEKEHLHATEGARMWEGRFVRENRVTHILVVTDSPDQSREINLSIERQLKAIDAGFALTVPIEVHGMHTTEQAKVPSEG
jgi:hypothetical protein